MGKHRPAVGVRQRRQRGGNGGNGTNGTDGASGSVSNRHPESGRRYRDRRCQWRQGCQWRRRRRRWRRKLDLQQGSDAGSGGKGGTGGKRWFRRRRRHRLHAADGRTRRRRQRRHQGQRRHRRRRRSGGAAGTTGTGRFLLLRPEGPGRRRGRRGFLAATVAEAAPRAPLETHGNSADGDINYPGRRWTAPTAAIPVRQAPVVSCRHLGGTTSNGGARGTTGEHRRDGGRGGDPIWPAESQTANLQQQKRATPGLRQQWWTGAFGRQWNGMEESEWTGWEWRNGGMEWNRTSWNGMEGEWTSGMRNQRQRGGKGGNGGRPGTSGQPQATAPDGRHQPSPAAADGGNGGEPGTPGTGAMAAGAVPAAATRASGSEPAAPATATAARAATAYMGDRQRRR